MSILLRQNVYLLQKAFVFQVDSRIGSEIHKSQ